MTATAGHMDPNQRLPKLRIVQAGLGVVTLLLGIAGLIEVATGRNGSPVFVLGIVCMLALVALEPIVRRKGGA